MKTRTLIWLACLGIAFAALDTVMVTIWALGYVQAPWYVAAIGAVGPAMFAVMYVWYRVETRQRKKQ